MQSKIVVVSKFRQNADDLKSLFLKEGFEVFSVSEPTSSNIELINNLSPDVVFLELEHGGFDAIDLCYQLKKEKKMKGFVHHNTKNTFNLKLIKLVPTTLFLNPSTTDYFQKKYLH
ncbi:MAG TPA: hypothetical protein PK833_01435 [Vicingus sp.]|nr:hypothetical protein [Vicingus sp.]